MKLKDKFFKAFFYPFLLGVLLSMAIVIVFLSVFTNNYLDKRTGENIVELEKKYAKMTINSVNALLSTILLKVQASLNEQVLFYQKLARKVNNLNSLNPNPFLRSAVDIDDSIYEKEKGNFKYMGFWFIDNYTTKDNFTKDNLEMKQLVVYSNILQNVYATLAATKSLVLSYYFIFDKTDLFIAFPLEYFYLSGYIDEFKNYHYNPA